MSRLLRSTYINFVTTAFLATNWLLILLPQQTFAQRILGSTAAVGTLVLHGGGHVSHDLRTAFTQYAGGRDAKIVIVPTADVSNPTDLSRLSDWQRCNPHSVQLLHADSRDEASKEQFSRVLDEATGVLGESTVTVCLAHANNQEQYVRELKRGDKGDLRALKKLAKSRLQEPSVSTEK